MNRAAAIVVAMSAVAAGYASPAADAPDLDAAVRGVLTRYVKFTPGEFADQITAGNPRG